MIPSIHYAVLRLQFLCFLRHNRFGYQEFALEIFTDELVVASERGGDCVGATLRPLLLRALVFLGCNV